MQKLQSINVVKNILDNNNVVAFPTDTVFGLVGKAFDVNIINKIYEIKNRDRNKKLILFIKNINEIKKYVEDIPEVAKDLINKNWPGKLTIIFNTKKELYNKYKNENFSLELLPKTIGIRIPNDENLLKLLNILDYPLYSTSANISGEKSCINSDEVIEKLNGRVDYVMEGSCPLDSKASTIIDVTENKIKILRQGEVYAKES